MKDEAIENKLIEKSGVIGFAQGYKIVNGETTDTECVTVYVYKKRANVQAKDLVSEYIGNIVTDVVELGRLRLENALHVRTTTNRGNRGASGLFAMKAGKFFSVACAHVLKDGQSLLTSAASVEYYRSPDWKPFGVTAVVREDLGGGRPFSDWGAFDGGLIGITDPKINSYVQKLPSSNFFNHRLSLSALRGLKGKSVFAIRANKKRLTASVHTAIINKRIGGVPRQDIFIRRKDGVGLTRPGDSGIIWRLSDGTPLSVHYGGYKRDSKNRSIISASFFVRRIEQRFSVRLIDPFRKP